MTAKVPKFCVFRSQTKMNRWDGFSTIRVRIFLTVLRKIRVFVNFTNKIQEDSEFVVNNNFNDLIALDHWALVINQSEPV